MNNQDFEDSSTHANREQDPFVNFGKVISHAVVACSTDGSILAFDSNAIALFEDSELSGRALSNFITTNEHETMDEHEFETQIPKRRKYVLRKPDGQLVPIFGFVETRTGRDGCALALVYHFEIEPLASGELDSVHSACIRRLRETEQDLVAARQALSQAAAAKSKFLSNMSHELRTPLNAVIGMSEVLWETGLSDEQRKVLAVLKNGGRSLLEVINDILNQSWIECGQDSIETSSFNVSNVVKKVVEGVQDHALKKNIELRTTVDSKIDQVVGDVKRFEQVLSRLIGNALKFTDRGSISVDVHRDSSSAQNLYVSIADTGIGIPDEKLTELFQLFTQLDSSSTKSYGGVGLGLAISKQLVESMGGVIWAESKWGHGTTIHFRVRMPSADLSSDIETPLVNTEFVVEQAPPTLRVLVVEDSSDNAFLVANYLKNFNCELDFAQNGKIAVELFEQSNYDLVLMDIQMPEMDGYAATRWIRILELSRSRRTPIIALTAFTSAEEIQKTLDSGCDAHLSKPIAKSTLLKAIRERVELKPVVNEMQVSQCEL